MNARILSLLLTAGLAACAAEIERSATNSHPRREENQPVTLHVREALTLTPNTGYATRVRAGSTWQLVGTTDQGGVYRPVGDAFSVEGANRHEAYVVIGGGKIVGFYLPGERAFAPLPQPVVLPAQ